MTLNKFIFKSHKWLAVATAVAAVAWFVTGLVIVLPAGLLGRGGRISGPPGENVEFAAARITVPEAISAAQTSAGKAFTVSGVTLGRLPGKLLYEISAANGAGYLVDAVEGTYFEITPESSRKMAETLLAGQASVLGVELEQNHTLDYMNGPVPFYRVRVDDPGRTYLYFAKGSSSMRSSNRMGRVRALFHDAHTFAILLPVMPRMAVRVLLILMSAVGTLMALFGVWILWIQTVNWWNARKSRTLRPA